MCQCKFCWNIEQLPELHGPCEDFKPKKLIISLPLHHQIRFWEIFLPSRRISILFEVLERENFKKFGVLDVRKWVFGRDWRWWRIEIGYKIGILWRNDVMLLFLLIEEKKRMNENIRWERREGRREKGIYLRRRRRVENKWDFFLIYH